MPDFTPLASCPICGRVTFDPDAGGFDVRVHLLEEHQHRELARAVHQLLGDRERIAVAAAGSDEQIVRLREQLDVETLRRVEVEEALARRTRRPVFTPERCEEHLADVDGFATVSTVAARYVGEEVRGVLRRLHEQGRVERRQQPRADGHGTEFAYRLRRAGRRAQVVILDGGDAA
jgi:hypothetical protein